MKKCSGLKYILAPYVRVGFNQGKLSLGFGSIQSILENPCHIELALALAEIWKTPKSLEEVEAAISLLHLSSQSDRDFVLNCFFEKNLLIHEDLHTYDDRYSRHYLFYSLCGAIPDYVQQTIENKHVAVLGCGGIGNLAAVTLATAGVRRLTLVDGDWVEASNLSRQIIYTQNHIDRLKVMALKEELNLRHPKTEIECFAEPVTEAALEKLDTETLDLIILSADTPGIYSWVNKFAVKNKIAFISIGYIQDVAVFGPFVIPNKTGCHACKLLIANNEGVTIQQAEQIQRINTGYQAPSIGPINMMAASHGLLDCLKYLGNFGTIHSLNARIGIWSHDFHIQKQDCSRNPDCEVCGKIEDS